MAWLRLWAGKWGMDGALEVQNGEEKQVRKIRGMRNEWIVRS